MLAALVGQHLSSPPVRSPSPCPRHLVTHTALTEESAHKD